MFLTYVDTDWSHIFDQRLQLNRSLHKTVVSLYEHMIDTNHVFKISHFLLKMRQCAISNNSIPPKTTCLVPELTIQRLFYLFSLPFRKKYKKKQTANCNYCRLEIVNNIAYLSQNITSFKITRSITCTKMIYVNTTYINTLTTNIIIL